MTQKRISSDKQRLGIGTCHQKSSKQESSANNGEEMLYGLFQSASALQAAHENYSVQ